MQVLIAGENATGKARGGGGGPVQGTAGWLASGTCGTCEFL